MRRMRFPCLQMEILSSNFYSQMLLSSLMLNQWYSKDLFWLLGDHAHSRWHPVFHMGDPTHHSAVVLRVPSSTLCSPLRPLLICPHGWCIFSLPSEPFFCLLGCLPPLHQEGCSSRILGELEEESTWRMLEEHPCSPSRVLLSQLSKPFSLWYFSVSTCQSTTLKYFWLYNLISHPGCKCYCCQSPRNAEKQHKVTLNHSN